MSKLLLKSFLPNSKQDSDMRADDKKELVELAKELKPFWQEASKDLLKPNPKIVAGIMNNLLQEQ